MTLNPAFARCEHDFAHCRLCADNRICCRCSAPTHVVHQDRRLGSPSGGPEGLTAEDVKAAEDNFYGRNVDPRPARYAQMADFLNARLASAAPVPAGSLSDAENDRDDLLEGIFQLDNKPLRLWMDAKRIATRLGRPDIAAVAAQCYDANIGLHAAALPRAPAEER